MLFEDLFFDDETHAPVNNTNIRVNQLGRTINLQAESWSYNKLTG